MGDECDTRVSLSRSIISGIMTDMLVGFWSYQNIKFKSSLSFFNAKKNKMGPGKERTAIVTLVSQRGAEGDRAEAIDNMEKPFFELNENPLEKVDFGGIRPENITR